MTRTVYRVVEQLFRRATALICSGVRRLSAGSVAPRSRRHGGVSDGSRGVTYGGVGEKVHVLNAAAAEIAALPPSERVAMDNAVAKLEALGEALGFPHSSHVKGRRLRESRPRRGRSPWRAFYQRMGDEFVVVALVGPEALPDPRGFRRTLRVAQARIAVLEADR